MWYDLTAPIVHTSKTSRIFRGWRSFLQKDLDGLVELLCSFVGGWEVISSIYYVVSGWNVPKFPFTYEWNGCSHHKTEIQSKLGGIPTDFRGVSRLLCNPVKLLAWVPPYSNRFTGNPALTVHWFRAFGFLKMTTLACKAICSYCVLKFP